MLAQKYIDECLKCPIEEDIKKQLCPVCLTQKIIRGKWKIVIIWLLRKETLRFSQIRKSIPKVTQAYLSSQLKELEADGLLIRKSYNEVPPKVEYYLTNTGKNLIHVIDKMFDWGSDYIADNMPK
ncbi:helix-turn-helix transcriptional regulator [Vallitalea pronyensis]|uniref:Helix-turn-helix transcriptional regulator n=1 Tax=Vallitalea pronyensis TaxID=1348613 RepID=A0A8J8MG60_9FIRM|nr:helix-turn-helix domain-containing protein [Vallitalea pronyensis]QUI20946.1 helix-turn-helix transcriptional regulator [Vallitalea pronyensis]